MKSFSVLSAVVRKFEDLNVSFISDCAKKYSRILSRNPYTNTNNFGKSLKENCIQISRAEFQCRIDYYTVAFSSL
jgi:hypothetical protein